ncbi:MAG: C-type lectin domain-containing protein, partial [Thermofilaceae archaeon]
MKRFIPFLLLFLLCSSANASFKKLRVLIYKEPGYSGGWQTHEVSPQEPPPPMHCPEGSLYNMSAGRCEMYKFLTVFAVSTFDDGRAFCRNLGGILAEIDNSTENTQAKDVASRLGYSVWIGGTDQGSEGTWRWVESGRVFYIKGQSSQPGYSNWASSSYPRTNTSYNCAYMNTGGYWYDDSCTSTNYRPLCELYVSDA